MAVFQEAFINGVSTRRDRTSGPSDGHREPLRRPRYLQVRQGCRRSGRWIFVTIPWSRSIRSSWIRCKVHFMRNILAKVLFTWKRAASRPIWKQIWLEPDKKSARRGHDGVYRRITSALPLVFSYGFGAACRRTLPVWIWGPIRARAIDFFVSLSLLRLWISCPHARLDHVPSSLIRLPEGNMAVDTPCVPPSDQGVIFQCPPRVIIARPLKSSSLPQLGESLSRRGYRQASTGRAS